AGTTEGVLTSCNNDGTILCGGIGDGDRNRAYIINYDKTARTFERVAVPLWPGSASSTAYAVSETGIVVGVEDSRTFVYDMNSGEKYEMADYLRYLYGVQLPENIIPFNTTSHISDNGRVIVGTGNPNAEIPYLIVLGEHQLHAMARAVSARQVRGAETATVKVEWNKPLIGEYTLKGYWVYRDSVKMNPTMLGADEISFTDLTVSSGVHTYAVQAVYDDNVETEYAFATAIRVIAPGECLPVQEIYSDIVYNRTVNLYWNLPSDKVTAPAAKKSAAKGYQARSLDVVDAFNVKNSNASSAVRIGRYIYATAFQSDLVTIFDAETGEVVKTVAVEDFKGAYDLTAHGHSIYVAGNDYVVRELTIDPEDPFDVQMGTYWLAKAGKLTHIAYVENDDETVNNGEDYLALGAYNNIMFYPVNAKGENDTLPGSEKFRFRAYSIGGSEVYDGKLYVANQGSLTGSEVDVFDLATGERLFTEDFAALPQITSVVGTDGMIVSGITKSELEDGMVILQCMVQPRAMFSTNFLFNMELESWPETTGYDVYRNGEKINTEIVKARRYSDVVYDAGTYEYTVKYVSNTCTKESEVKETVVINPIGECEKPGNVKATEANGQIVVTWTRPTDAAKTFVGFNIYRNGEQKVELLRDERWLDLDKLQKDDQYIYRVEAFYNNSCVASDSISITPTFQGVAMPPSMVSASENRNADDTYDVEVTWGLPYFEAPMAYGYCGAPAGSLTPAGVSTVFALIGWDTASLPFFEDLYLVGMEYIVGTTALTSLDGVVFIDNKIVHTQPMDRYQAEKWQTLNFTKAFAMNYKTELAVGYIASFDPSTLSSNVVVHDAGPGKRAFSDILSFDGKTSTTLAAAGRDANLCINALIVRRRDLEAAALAPDPAAYLQEKMIRTEMPWQVASSSVLTDAPKTTSEGIKLLGFNVYLNNKKLNDTTLTVFSVKENGVVPNGDEINYAVGALYEGADEQLAEDYIDLRETGIEEGEAFGMRIYPNPVGENLHVAGEYRTLFITDLAGKRVGKVLENAETVSMTALQSGVYLLHFTLVDGRNLVVKVVKR
ncbi:MAG: T9SS type A sorting domain-containing protein, partial [Bacteroidales bacterium]|nr:T9SS type A sorting domain-containing protein [Bacteroidales bacterium]